MPFRTLAAVAIIAGTLCAQSKSDAAAKDDADAKRPKEAVALTDQARALPAEFCADVLLTLAASPLIADAKWRRELIEESFTVGARAQLPYERAVYGLGMEARTHQEYTRQGLEALTLQTRAVDAMLQIDGARALAMFEEMRPLNLAEEKCSDAATAHLAGYYETVANLFARGFTAKQHDKEEHLHFIQQRIAAIRSPVQVFEMMHLLLRLQVTPEERERLFGFYAVVLDTVPGSNRAYGWIENGLVPQPAPGQNAGDMQVSKLLWLPLRSYIVRQVAGPRCTDFLKTGTPSVVAFNALAAKLDPEASWLKPITPDEAKPARDAGTFAPELPFGSSAKSKQVLLALKWLDHGDGLQARSFTAEKRKSAEWNDHFLALLAVIEGWKEDDEDTPEDYLINQAHTYAALARNAPPGAAKENVMGRYLNFIETHYLPAGKLNLWFAQVTNLLDQLRRPQDNNEKQWVLDHLSRSTNPVIALYTQLELKLASGKRYRQ